MRAQRKRAGFTLLELMLVLMIIAALAAAAWPALTGSLALARLRSAAEDVRTAWGKARVEAMRSGQIHIFQYEPNSRRYALEQWESDDAMLEASVADGAASDTAAGQPTTASAGKLLPEGVVFVGSSTEDDARAAALSASTAAGDTFGAQWEPPILFYPDGTTSTARLTLAGEEDTRILLTLRGLTGIAQISDILAADDEALVSD